MAEPWDVLIAGGGPVGSAVAIALAGTPLKVALLDPAAGTVPGADPRPIALSHGSRLLLETLGCWSGIEATPIHAIHVSQRGGFGRTLITREEHRLPALGHVADYDVLARVLGAGAARFAMAAKVATVSEVDGLACAQTTQGPQFARLVVAADGGQLVESRSREYGQVALLARIGVDTPHAGRAWERFTADGPLALLPFGPGYALVWSTSPERAAELGALGETQFLDALQQAFGRRAGRFVSAGTRSTFPLALRRATQAPARCAIVGNASQTLHPVAGQGLNLGLRDAMELAQLITGTPRNDLGSPGFIKRFEAARATDRRAGIGITDMLVRLFSNANPVAGLGRGAGLFMLDMLPAPRRFLARRMMFGMRALP